MSWGRGHGAVEVVLTTWVGNQEAEAFYGVSATASCRAFSMPRSGGG